MQISRRIVEKALDQMIEKKEQEKKQCEALYEEHLLKLATARVEEVIAAQKKDRRLKEEKKEEQEQLLQYMNIFEEMKHKADQLGEEINSLKERQNEIVEEAWKKGIH